MKMLFLIVHFIFISIFSSLGNSKLFLDSLPANYGENPTAGSYYSIRGMKMYVEVYGKGKPLLMIHGNGGSISSFKNIIPFFSKHYKVIVADSRSQGRSKDEGDSLSFEMMADDESALLKAMHISSAYVLGWSDGGIVALLLAMQHPHQVIKLVSTGANLWPDSTAIVPSDWLAEKKHFNSQKRKFRTMAQKMDWKLFMLDWLQPNIPLDSLQTIQAPSLIIGGDHDMIKIEHTVLIYEHIPKAYLWIVPNSGHATFIEHKNEFIRVVNNFFQKPFINR
ncbi:MAG: alpha/beta fold hydrolase [Chitinophagaceae bacterium]